VSNLIWATRGMSLAEKIDRLSMPEPNSGCRLWLGDCDDHGYARLYWEGRSQKAYRLVWAEKHGPIPPGILIRHRCDNPACVEEDHLLDGTDRDNSDDKVSRRRHRFGSGIHTAKLSEKMISVVMADPRSNSALARELGVHNSTISRIRSGVRWKHVARVEYELAKTQVPT
jgi:hypothetical protein